MVEFSYQAFADLQAIEQWIAKNNPRVAREKAVMLAETCELLDSSPNIGTPYVNQIRHHTKEAWVIIYRPTETGVYIYRVFDARQNWRATLLSGTKARNGP